MFTLATLKNRVAVAEHFAVITAARPWLRRMTSAEILAIIERGRRSNLFGRPAIEINRDCLLWPRATHEVPTTDAYCPCGFRGVVALPEVFTLPGDIAGVDRRGAWRLDWNEGYEFLCPTCSPDWIMRPKNVPLR